MATETQSYVAAKGGRQHFVERYEALWLCSYVAIWLCGRVAMCLCRCVLCGYMASGYVAILNFARIPGSVHACSCPGPI